jgi:hypothetical protein
VLLVVTQPAVVFGAREWGIFLLANAIIFYFCAGRLIDDIKRWVRPRG